MRLSIRTFAVAGGVFFALSTVGATVLAFPVPPVRDEAQLLKASALDKGYGINSFEAAESDCRLIQLDTIDGSGRRHPHIVQQCD